MTGRTVENLLDEYPNGFSVSASGTINRTIAASSHLPAIASRWPTPPPAGGYLVVDAAGETCSACGNKVQDCLCYNR